METFSTLLAVCAGNSQVTGEFPSQRPVTRSFDVFFDLRLNKQLRKQSWGWWFQTPSHSLWHHCNAVTAVSMLLTIINCCHRCHYYAVNHCQLLSVYCQIMSAAIRTSNTHNFNVIVNFFTLPKHNFTHLGQVDGGLVEHCSVLYERCMLVCFVSIISEFIGYMGHIISYHHHHMVNTCDMD